MNNVVLEKSRKFGFRIVKMSKFLADEEQEFVLSKQILRSGTSIGANVTEAQFAISKKEFSLKMYIAYKECGETLYWLDMLKHGDYLTDEMYNSMTNDCKELQKLLTAITKSSKK